MKKLAVVFLAAISLLLALAMPSGRGQYQYDLNATAGPDLTTIPLQSSSWKEALGEAVLPFLDTHDTEYAAGFREDVFRSLEMGISQDEVRRRLGAPISTKSFPDGITYWYHSRHGAKSKSYFMRILAFDSQGTLRTRRAEFYID